MISVDYVQTMARYNEWQNRSLFGAADTIGETARKQDRGAFFGSIHGTLSHLLWGDQQWLSRFAPSLCAKPPTLIRVSPGNYPDWEDLSARRRLCDRMILDWAATLDPVWLQGALTWYSGAAKSDMTRPHWLLVTHVFNHQTHHRGQVHAMLTAAGAKPDDTDLMLMT